MRLPLLLLATALLAVLGGCGDEDRKPIPIITVLVHAGGDSYTLNGEAMGDERLRKELTRLADENRRNITGNARANVRIVTDPGAYEQNKQNVIDLCLGVGLVNIQTSAANRSP
jgi:hypothetical protein